MPSMGLFMRDEAGVEHPVQVEAPPPPAQAQQQAPAQAAEPHPDVKAALEEAAKLREDLAKEREARAAEAKARAEADQKAKADGIRAAAKQFSAARVKANALLPHGAAHAEALHAFAHLSAAGLPAVDAAGKPIDPVAAIGGVFAAIPPHTLTEEALKSLPAGAVVLEGDAGLRDLKAWAKQVNDRNAGGFSGA